MPGCIYSFFRKVYKQLGGITNCGDFMLALYIPCKDKQQAMDIAAHLLKKKLIACANIIPSTSMYLWEGKLETNEEHIILAKTADNKYKAIEKAVLALHSYTCPCITAWKIDKVLGSYARWVKQMVK